jgi:serine/threonine-protein phosphatase CPPED1
MPAMQFEMRSGRYFKIGLVLLLLALGLFMTGMQSNTAKEPFVFVQISDTQLGYGGYEHDVSLFRKAVEQINALKPDFVVFCGDFVEDFDQQSIADFNKIRSELIAPSYLTPGNHELYYQPTSASLSRYRRIFGKDYFSFAHKGYTFVFADSQLWKSPLKGETEKLDAWFKQTLAAAREAKSPVFIVQHIPVFLKRPDEPEDPDYNLSPARRKELLALMEDSGVVAVLGGHTHQAVINNYRGIQLVNTGALSKNDDKSAVGYRIWRVESAKSIKHEFVPLEAAAAR